MRYYINPPDMTKEEFKQKGTPIDPDAVKNFDFNSDSLPVCLVDNGAFTAAAIAYDQREANVFLAPDRREYQRPRTWFSVSQDNLKPYLKSPF